MGRSTTEGSEIHFDDLTALRQVLLFRDLAEQDLAALAQAATRKEYQLKQCLSAVGEGTGQFLGVIQGGLRLFRSTPDKEVTLASFGPGDAFGLSSWAVAVARASTIEATICGTVVYHLARARVQRLLVTHPQLALTAVEMLGRALAEVADWVEDLVLYDVHSRLAHELARQAANDSAHSVSATHEQLAARIGTKQQEVTRGVHTLREQLLIETRPHRRGITVLQPSKLQVYGKEDS